MASPDSDAIAPIKGRLKLRGNCEAGWGRKGLLVRGGGNIKKGNGSNHRVGKILRIFAENCL